MSRAWQATSLAAAALCLASPSIAGAAVRGPAATYPASMAGWAASATRPLAPLGASDLGRVPGAMPMHIVVGLQMRDREGARQVVRRQRTPGDLMFHQALTPDQFTARFNPTGAQVAAVGRYLASRGFANLRVEPNNLIVSGDASAAAVQAAFGTQIHAFRQTRDGLTHAFYSNVTPALVPAALRGTILSVLGLHNFQMQPFLRKSPAAIQAHLAAWQAAQQNHNARNDAAAPAPTAQPCFTTPPPVQGFCSREYGPYDFQAAYDGLHATTGRGTSIAIFAEGNVAQVVKDLPTYQKTFGLKPFPVTVVPVGRPSSDTSGQDEFDLDTQSSTGIAGGVKHLYIYDTTSLSDADTSLEFNRFVTDRLAQAGSASFGEPEALAYADGAMLLDDEIFNQGAAQGQTVFTSSGDNGAACPVIAATGVPFVPGVVGVCYPASSPDVIAVGGTTLLTDQNTSAYGGEIGWQGTGGGQSQFEAPTDYQKAAVSVVFTADGMDRAVPDIAMDADNNVSPAVVIVSGKATGVGGTSLSSPLSLGVWARLLTAHPGKFGSPAPFGFAGPALYYEYTQFPQPTPPPVPTGPPGFETSPIGGYHDIRNGFNGLFPALPGYDLMTGLGTLDIGLQIKDIDLPGAP